MLDFLSFNHLKPKKLTLHSVWLIPVLFVFALPFASGQHQEHHAHKKEKGIYEIITSGIYAYSFAHEEWVPGTEVHFTYWFDHSYGTGLSYTAKFDQDETLHDIALLASWNPTRWITLNVGPNFSIPSDHRDFLFSAYTEAEFNIRPTEWFHFGPVLGAILGKESELAGGFHLGFEF